MCGYDYNVCGYGDALCGYDDIICGYSDTLFGYGYKICGYGDMIWWICETMVAGPGTGEVGPNKRRAGSEAARLSVK